MLLILVDIVAYYYATTEFTLHSFIYQVLSWSFGKIVLTLEEASPKMQEYNVFEKITADQRPNWHLYIDAIYKSNPNAKNLGGEVLSKLLSVGNQGGFRFKGKTESPQLVALFTSGEDVYWRDDLDSSLGIFLYYGDQKTPGKDLHDTKLNGNLILKHVFDYACSDNPAVRKKVPPIFVFKKVHGRDIKFLGLAVPGIQGKPQKDWLTAVWGSDRNGDRFLNYKSFFTILDTAKGCEAEKDESGISLAWLTDIEAGKAYESQYAPSEWKKYIDRKKFLSLTALEKHMSRARKNNSLTLMSLKESRCFSPSMTISLKKTGGIVLNSLHAQL